MKRLILLTTAVLLFTISIFSAQNDAIRVDMEGYRTLGNKFVILVGNSATSFTVKTVSGGTTVFTGTFGTAIADAASGDSVKIGDFSALTTPGEYYVAVTGLGESYNFRISDTIHTDTLTTLMRGFYGQRCGASVTLTHRGTTFTHGACHLNDGTYAGSTGLSGTKNTTGGWHDAGDYGKYSLNCGVTNGELLLMYEKYYDALEHINLGLPYSGGALPDVLTEIKYNLDWHKKMQHTNGGVFHKLSNGFPQGIMPTADTDTRYIFEISSAATADFAAIMAIAARVFEMYDAAYAAECLTAAQNAWAFLQANPNIVPAGGFTDGSMGGIYGDTDDSDERLWAAVELFNTTGETTYNTYVADHYLDRALTLMSDSGDDWKELHPVAYMSYMQSKQPSVNATVVNVMKAGFQNHVNTFRTRVQSTNGYKFVLNSGDYYWGSNSVALNRAIRLVAASEIFGDDTYKDAAEEVLHYILGRNAMNKSYLTYVGEVYTSQPHHQPSAADGITPPWPGILAGGPNEYYDTIGAPAKCYVDDAGNYTSNEVAINWMAAYAYVLAAFVPTPGPTNTPTNTPTSLCHPLTCTFTNTDTPTVTPTPINVLRVNVAGAQVTTGGNVWLADKAYTAGSWGYNTPANTGDRTAQGDIVNNTTDDILYLTERWGASLSYTFDLADGWYLVTLKFNEMFVNSANARLFNILLEGQVVESSFSVYGVNNSQAYAVDKSYPVQVTDGKLNIDLTQVTEMCILNALQIESYYPPTATYTYTPLNTNTFTNTATATATFTSTSTSECYPLTCTFTNTNTYTSTQTPTNTPVPTPIRVNCGGLSYLDGAGNTWSADYGFTGGTAASVTDAIANTTDDTLYQSERYGNPSYTFTVPNGYYDITFKFAETWFNAEGERIFDVEIEGVTVIDNLDLYVEAPGTMRAYDVIIQDVLITDGQINITSSSDADVANFRAIAIIPAGPAPTSTYTNTLPPTNTYTNTNTDTATATTTFTHTYTATYTATNTYTHTHTSSHTATNTPEPPTATHTVTDTATHTYTNTNISTFTYTHTHTATHTNTETPTDTNTATITNTPPPGSTNTYTFTITSTPSDTHTATYTYTYTFTNTATQTYTEVPPTFTSTFTETFTFTYTSTYTHTATITDTVPPGSTDTHTPTQTLIPSSTHTHTATQTHTYTNTYTATNTFTNTDTVPPGSTNTNTPTETLIPSNTHTATHTYTFTNTAIIPTNTYTATFSNTQTPTLTATVPAPTFTETPSSIIAQEGQQKITDVLVYPVPLNPEKYPFGLLLRFNLTKSSSEITLKIYSSSFRLVRSVALAGTFVPGVNRGFAESAQFKNLANGTYYYRLSTDSSDGVCYSKAGKIIIIK
ncbi:MAG: glycoside hydrolase family 9 protein [Candidatus Goldbacteria bacterium]|nr:glycoside hydrolase family 9 protein [Candidatus Goldiibacteriota bacterium]